MENLLPPITSLISKSEKAIQKLKPGSWQYTMLKGNIEALHFAASLMSGGSAKQKALSKSEIQEHLQAIDAMIVKSHAAQKKFLSGTAPHSLLKNRIASLQAAQALFQ